MSEQDVLDKIDDAIEKIDSAIEKIHETKDEILLSRAPRVSCGYCGGNGVKIGVEGPCPDCEGLGYIILKEVSE